MQEEVSNTIGYTRSSKKVTDLFSLTKLYK
jgi:hypothetical protein